MQKDGRIDPSACPFHFPKMHGLNCGNGDRARPGWCKKDMRKIPAHKTESSGLQLCAMKQVTRGPSTRVCCVAFKVRVWSGQMQTAIAGMTDHLAAKKIGTAGVMQSSVRPGFEPELTRFSLVVVLGILGFSSL
jgi:hypothetical protein